MKTTVFFGTEVRSSNGVSIPIVSRSIRELEQSFKAIAPPGAEMNLNMVTVVQITELASLADLMDGKESA
jgi:hypothetical protein